MSGADATAAGACSDETVVMPAPTEASPELAWSQDDGDQNESRPHESWRATVVAAVAVLIVSACIAFVIASWSRPHASEHVLEGGIMEPPAPAAALPPRVTTPQPTFNGLYKIDFDFSQATFRGNTTPPNSHGIKSSWWSFRSSCAPECIATGTKVDAATDPRPIAPTDEGPTTSSLRFLDGVWKPHDAPFRAQQRCPSGAAAETMSMSWEFEPAPDGTMRGFETNVVETNECGFQGNVVKIPFTARLVGPGA